MGHDNSPTGTMTTKWSSKPPDHKANRVRNNQRRHRARVKTHIADLEAKLAEAQQELIAAHTRIEELVAEVKSLRNTTSPYPVSAVDGPGVKPEHSIIPQGTSEPCCGEVPAGPKAQQDTTTLSCSLESSEMPHDNDISATESSEATVGGTIKSPLGLQITPATDTWKQNDALEFVTQYDGSHLPPPRPGESTTTCLTAFGIIAQHNFSGIDDDSIRQWLQPGFRGPNRPGGECRVETHLLCSLMDYICPV